jgi:hypothetical protein
LRNEEFAARRKRNYQKSKVKKKESRVLDLLIKKDLWTMSREADKAANSFIKQKKEVGRPLKVKPYVKDE